MLKKTKKTSILQQFWIAGIVALLAIFISPVVAQTNLAVDFSANPNSGTAPLNDVDLTATVSGTATGPITYKFDCTADGSWEKTITINKNSYTATDLCDYPNSGNYRAKVSVGREGLFFEGTTAIMVNGGSDLSVTLSVNPSSGSAPLQDVDLKATVSGTTNGDVTYRFDCNNDGVWEKTITTSSTTYIASDLCSYPKEGNYTAKVKVERGNLSFQGTAAVAVYKKSSENTAAPPTFTIKKLGRNISRNETAWQKTVDAKGGERIAFRIEISAGGNSGTVIKNLRVSDALASGLLYEGNLTVNGIPQEGEILSGIDLGNLTAGEQKILIFEAKVKPEEEFSFGITPLSNVAIARTSEGLYASDAMLIRVQKTGVLGAATEISTAQEGYIPAAALALTFLLALFSISYIAEEFQIGFLKKFIRKYLLWKSFVIPNR